MKILLVEDDPTLNKNISEALKADGFAVTTIYDGLLAQRALKREQFDLVILDINLPGITGFDLCKQFRVADTTTPVMMLTAFGTIEDKLEGFHCGADDYLTKPFYMSELLVRARLLLKRNKPIPGGVQNTITADDIVLNDVQKKVFRQGKEIILTPREYQILYKLMERPGELVSKGALINEIWGSAFDANTNTIEVYINFLRNKIDKPFNKQTIKTKVGFGYYLDIL